MLVGDITGRPARGVPDADERRLEHVVLQAQRSAGGDQAAVAAEDRLPIAREQRGTQWPSGGDVEELGTAVFADVPG